MNSLTWLPKFDKPIKLPTTHKVLSFQLINKGTQLLVATKAGCFITTFGDTWKWDKLFYNSSIEPKIVKVVPREDSFQILCAYPNFATLIEFQNDYNIYTTTVLKTFCLSENEISYLDTQEDYFITSDTENCVQIFSYSSRNPLKVLHYSELEILCGFKSISHDFRKIRKICFDSISNKHIFAFISYELCFVYDIESFSLINYLTITDYNRTSSPSSSSRFRSFTFCGKGYMYILCDTEIIKWNYYSCSINSLPYSTILKLEKPCRNIHLSGDNSILEVLSQNEVVFYLISSQEQEVIHDTTKTETLTYISYIPVSIDVDIDSYIDRIKEKYIIIIRRNKRDLLLYSKHNEQSKSLNVQIFSSRSNTIPHHNQHYSDLDSSSYYKSDNRDSHSDLHLLQANSDFEETIGTLMVSDTNSSIELIQYSFSKGLIVVGFTLLNASIKVTISFNNHLSDSNKQLSSSPSKGSSFVLSSKGQLTSHLLSYNNLMIDAELMDNNPRVQGLMDLIRFKLNQLVIDMKMEVNKEGTQFNRLYELLKKILKIVDEINVLFPMEKKKETTTQVIEEERKVENDDSLIEPPGLFFVVFCNDISIRVNNSRYINGIDIGKTPPLSYLDYKNIEHRHSQAFDSDSDNELFTSSDSSETTNPILQQPIVSTYHTSIILDYHQTYCYSSLLQFLQLPSFSSSLYQLSALNDCVESNLQKLATATTILSTEDIEKQTSIWKMIRILFCRNHNHVSFGAVSFLRSILNHLWNSLLEYGDLLMLAIVVVFCRIYSRMSREDIFMLITNGKTVDIDNILLMMISVLDKKQVYDKKMEFEKFVLNSSKLIIPYIPLSESTMNTPTEVPGTRSRNKNYDIDDESGKKSSATGFEDSQTQTPTSGNEKEVATCCICKKQVFGMSIICQFCGHVFHIKHYMDWFNEHKECPVIGCQHCCNHNQMTEQLL